jgi:hypothetical protein
VPVTCHVEFVGAGFSLRCGGSTASTASQAEASSYIPLFQHLIAKTRISCRDNKEIVAVLTIALRHLAGGLISLLCVASASAHHPSDVRNHTRPAEVEGTTVTQSQATDLTLTLTEAATRPIQTWIRTAGAIDKAGKTVTVLLSSPDAELVKTGQRIRTFPVSSRTQMHQGKVVEVIKKADGVLVKATIANQPRDKDSHYLVEIVVEQGPYLSIPNVSIIEEDSGPVVYLQQHPGHYLPQPIQIGLRGELYTQVLHGLNEGDQVVSIGSFFVDAEYKLKATTAAQGAMSHDHHH